MKANDYFHRIGQSLHDRGLSKPYHWRHVYPVEWWGAHWATDLISQGWIMATEKRAVIEAFRRDAERMTART